MRDSWYTKVAAVLAAVVLGGLLVGRADAQSPPPDNSTDVEQDFEEQPADGVSEYLEAAKLQALASGNVIAGPAQVRGTFGKGIGLGGTLWFFAHDGRRFDDDIKTVTLTVQNFSSECQMRFAIFAPDRRRDRLDVRAGHISSSVTVRRAQVIQWERMGPDPDGVGRCHFLWVLRETP